MYPSWIKTWDRSAQGPQNSSMLDRRIPQPSDMCACYEAQASFFSPTSLPSLNKLITICICRLYFMPDDMTDRLSLFLKAGPHLHFYITLMNCLTHQHKPVWDLTISVSVAEWDVFVLLFAFHLHCLSPTAGKTNRFLSLDLLNGGDQMIQSVKRHTVHAGTHLIK